MAAAVLPIEIGHLFPRHVHESLVGIFAVTDTHSLCCALWCVVQDFLTKYYFLIGLIITLALAAGVPSLGQNDGPLAPEITSSWIAVCVECFIEFSASHSGQLFVNHNYPLGDILDLRTRCQNRGNEESLIVLAAQSLRSFLCLYLPSSAGSCSQQHTQSDHWFLSTIAGRTTNHSVSPHHHLLCSRIHSEQQWE